MVILTGHGSERDEKEARRLGALDYLQKPVDIEILMDTIRRAGRSGATAPPDPSAGGTGG